MATKDKMPEGSSEEEKAESPEEALQEGDIKIPEQFQRDVYALVKQVNNQEQCDFICTCARQRCEELNSDDEEEYSTEGMPS